MVCPFYLAMTAAEFCSAAPLPAHPAWMACHFSPYGKGLSNRPSHLSKDSMLILNDRIPVADHDPDLIAAELQNLIDTFSVSRLLLDLQRPEVEQTKKIIDCILKKVSCEIGISHLYAADSYPVFVPPGPLDLPAESYLQKWQGQKIWLELAAQPLCLEVTTDGCREAQWCQDTNVTEHWDETLCCHYRIKTEKDHIQFYLYRSQEDSQRFMEQVMPFGVECGVGLYQEFGNKKTALQL